MKTRILSVVTITAIFFTSIFIWTRTQSAKEINAVADLALMLPDSDIIVAVDMNKTLNIVGPSLMSQDEKKIGNLKKLMKSMENTIGIDPYEIRQIVAGIKIPGPGEKGLFEGLDFTVIFKTATSNTALLEKWSKKMDAIDAFDIEKEPTEKFIDEFKDFRFHKLSKRQNDEIVKSKEAFDEMSKTLLVVSALLSDVPASAKGSKQYKDTVKRVRSFSESVTRYRGLLMTDVYVKTFHDSTLMLQNKWSAVSLDDTERTKKLAAILDEAKAIYPAYKAKVENVAKVDALLDLADYELYEKLSKKSLGLIKIDFSKNSGELMNEKLKEIAKTVEELSGSPARQSTQLKAVLKSSQMLDDLMGIKIKVLDDVEKFSDISELAVEKPSPPKNLSKSIKEHAKFSQVNGKTLITIDLEKINVWSPGFESDEEKTQTDVVDGPVVVAESNRPATNETPEKKTEARVVAMPVAMGEEMAKAKSEQEAEKKKELFAIGYIDETTMVIGFENGIRSILNRKTDYKNPKAAEMLASFKNPLISFATNSKIFQNVAKTFEAFSKQDDEKKKKATPSEKFFNDLNIFGSVEFDDANPTSSDLSMSLGFTKNKVEDVFDANEPEENETVVEMGDYQMSMAVLYDLLNTLKSYKASMSFTFEKKKLAALLESTPQIVEDIRSQGTKHPDAENVPKTRVLSLQNLSDILLSPKFYTTLGRARR